jgi:hypothetical protein
MRPVTASVISSMRSPSAIRLTQRITPVQRRFSFRWVISSLDVTACDVPSTSVATGLRLLCCRHFLQSLSAHHRLRDDEGLHPPDLGGDRVLRSQELLVPFSPCVRPVAGAWFPKAGVHRLCRTARSDPPLPKSSKTPTRPCCESVQILRKDPKRP